jgi:hypothetical protein
LTPTYIKHRLINIKKSNLPLHACPCTHKMHVLPSDIQTKILVPKEVKGEAVLDVVDFRGSLVTEFTKKSK